MGTCTVTIKRKNVNLGSVHGVIADIAPSSSYATGGETLKISDLGLQTLEMLIPMGAGSVLGHTISPVHGTTIKTDPLIFMRDFATGAQVSNAFDASTEIFRVLAIGEFAGV